MPLTTPAAISLLVRSFCAKIVPATLPFLVPVRPAPDALPGCSFENVAQKVARLGGEAHRGWAIKECRDYLVADPHAIWFTTAGPLDISPKPDDERQILFLPDAKTNPTGQAISSRFMPKTRRGRFDLLERWCAGEKIVLLAPPEPPSLWHRLATIVRFLSRTKALGGQ